MKINTYGFVLEVCINPQQLRHAKNKCYTVNGQLYRTANNNDNNNNLFGVEVENLSANIL